ncbi:hypothetical protein CEN47_11860 [Fischerella thermalis CCMEE 5319]|nr:hypothetical protein CEN47_11860 [Fischerella thermalis CCMEE 5319]
MDADWGFSLLQSQTGDRNYFCKAALDKLAAYETNKAVLLEIVLICSPLGIAPKNLSTAC